MKHASRRPLAWLIFDVRPKTTAMRSISMQSRKQGGDPIVFRWSRVRASTVGPFGLARLHRPGASRRRSAERTRGPGFGSPAALVGSLLPCSFSRRRLQARINSGVSFAQHCSNRPSPNKSPEPTPVAVMPRAISRVIEMKLQNPKRSGARVTPATGVAHL